MDLAWNAQPGCGLRRFDMGEGSGSRKGVQDFEITQKLLISAVVPSP
jgi:hypothetical protein